MTRGKRATLIGKKENFHVKPGKETIDKAIKASLSLMASIPKTGKHDQQHSFNDSLAIISYSTTYLNSRNPNFSR